MKKTTQAIIITGPGFEDSEVLYPFYRLMEAGINYDLVTSSNQEVKGKHGLVFKPTITIEEIQQNRYDLIIVPGGTEAPDRVRQVSKLVQFIHKSFKAGKVISAICHGPWVLIEAEIVRGKKATCYPGMKTDLINAGAFYTGEPVTVDHKLITGDHPRSLGIWMKTTLDVLARS